MGTKTRQNSGRSSASSGDPLALVISALERAGCDPQPAGEGKYESHCPVHRGKRRNLSIGIGETGAVVLHCFHKDERGEETCPARVIVERIGLRERDLYPATARKAQRKNNQTVGAPTAVNGAPTTKVTKPKGTGFSTPKRAADWYMKKLGCDAAKGWGYRLADGSECAVIFRFDIPGKGKEYRPIHKDGAVWRIGDPVEPLPLYNLPRIAAAPADQRVYFVEGEKCADLAAELNLLCTTTMHGAESPHRTDYTPLAGREIVILPDADSPGEGYARAVARLALQLDPPARLRIVRLPGLAKGEDLEEWKAKQPADSSPETLAAEINRLADAASHETFETLETLAAAEPPAPAPGIAASSAETPRFDFTDLGNARRLVHLHGSRIRYCRPYGAWLIYDGRRWVKDEHCRIEGLAKDIPGQVLAEIPPTKDQDVIDSYQKWYLASQALARLDSAIKLARSEPGIAVSPKSFDADPWALNVLNGTIDLRTGELRPHRPGDLITKLCPVEYDPAARAPRWEQFEREIFADDFEVVSYMRRAVGYAATALDDLQEMNLLFGDGSNGKNLYLDIIHHILGDYACVAESSLLLANRNESHPTGLADLQGRRFVAASETDDGRRFAESMVKRLTGEKMIKARFMRENFFEFPRTFKIFLATNAKPDIRGSDYGIWRRIRLVPFNVTFVKGDVNDRPVCPPLVLRAEDGLDRRLLNEAPGILALIIRGCLDWQSGGMRPPAAVTAATEEYREEMDMVRAFVREACEVAPFNPITNQPRCRPALLYQTYDYWCDQNGYSKQKMSGRRFAREITKLGHKDDSSNGERWRLGIRPRDSPSVHDGRAAASGAASSEKDNQDFGDPPY